MVTAKKISTPKPVAVAAVAATKPEASKKPAAKKTASATPNIATAVAAVPDKPLEKPKVKTVKTVKTAKTSQPKPATVSQTTLTAEQRNNYVEVAAFYIAERRGFAPGNPADDWCAAELEVDRLLASGQFNN